MASFFNVSARSDAQVLVSFFEGLEPRAIRAAEAATVETAKGICDGIKELVGSSGHGTFWPGNRVPSSAPWEPPAKQTGEYQDSWHWQVEGHGDYVIGTVGSDAPQAQRLELGFVGTDSRGRRYRQAPRPHVGPVVTVWQDRLGARLMELAALG